MGTLYLVEQNTVLRKTSNRLLLCRKSQKSKDASSIHREEVILELPCADVDHVMLFGNIQVTTQALHQLLSHGIELAIFSFSGKLLGQLTPPERKNIDLKLLQFERFKDPGFCLAFSKKIVQTKLNNAYEFIQKHQANHPGLFDENQTLELKKYITLCEDADHIDSLRGYEGSGTLCYYQMFGKMLVSPWTFDHRTRRPPRDPVNAVLSFGYVVVGTELQSLLDGAGFDPYLGFYHQIRYGRPGLALDLLELYRHGLVDRLALNLFNKSILSDMDFVRTPEGGVFLNTSGKVKFFKHYEAMLGTFGDGTEVLKPGYGFRSIFRKQVQMLTAVLKGEAPIERLIAQRS